MKTLSFAGICVSLLLIFGIFLLLHDILYHLGYVPPLGKKKELYGIHIHHGYIGLILIVVGIALLCTH